MNDQSVLKYIGSEKINSGTGKIWNQFRYPRFNLASGFKINLYPRIYKVSSMDLNIVPYDYLDVMHNFDEEGKRLELFGLYAEF